MRHDVFDLNDAYLFTSKNYVSYAIENKWIIYSPDTVGLPIVVSNLIQEILDLFKHGASVEDISNLIYDNNLCEIAEIHEIITYLFKQGFLKTPSPKDTRHKYFPIDFPQLNRQTHEIEIWLHITNYCNLDCEYCFVNKSKEHMENNTAWQIIKKIVSTAKLRQLKKITLKFAGGEAMLFINKIKSFSTLLKEALSEVNVDLNLCILTNGTVITNDIIAFLKEFDISVSISLDGYKDDHDIYRVFKNNKSKGSWDIVEKNIQSLIDNGISPYILATISEASSTSLTELCTWVYQKGLKMLLGVVREPQNLQNKSFETIKTAYKTLCNKMNEAFEKFFCEFQKIDYSIDFLKKINICELNFESPSFSTCCGIGTNHLVIKQDGSMASCPMTLSEMSIKAEDDLLVSARNSFPLSPLKREDMDGPKCIDCTWFPVCTGGCPVNNQRNAGHYFSVSPLHDFYQYVIPRYVNFYGYKILQYAKNIGNDDAHILSY